MASVGVGLLHAMRIFHRPYSALFNKTFCRWQQLNIMSDTPHRTGEYLASGASCGAKVQK